MVPELLLSEISCENVTRSATKLSTWTKTFINDFQILTLAFTQVILLMAIYCMLMVITWKR